MTIEDKKVLLKARMKELLTGSASNVLLVLLDDLCGEYETAIVKLQKEVDKQWKRKVSSN
jgi:hypothetical protein